MSDEITLPEEVRPGVTERPLSRKDARQVILRRWTDAGLSGTQNGDVAIAFTNQLPEELLYESVLSRIDLVPLLEEQSQNEEVHSYFRDRFAGAVERFQEAQREVVLELIDTTGMTEEQVREAAEAELAVGSDRTYRLSPEARVARTVSGERDVELSGSQGSQLTELEQRRAEMAGLFTPSTQQEEFNFLTAADMQAIFRLANSDLNTAQTVTNYYADVRAAQREGVIGPDVDVPEELRVIYEEGLEPETGLLDRFPVSAGATPVQQIEYERELANRQARMRGERSYTFTEALNLLWTMTPEELGNVQDMLMAAGYYETGDGRRAEGPMFRGDPTDELTQQAWRNLLSDSVRSREAMVPLLERRAEALAEQRALEEEQAETDRREEMIRRRREEAMVSMSDPVGLAAQAEDLAQRTIGRRLSQDEEQRIVEFIHQLERERGEQLITAGDGEEVFQIDVAAQIEDQIRRSAPLETAGQDVQGQYDAFTRLLAGPGGMR